MPKTRFPIIGCFYSICTLGGQGYPGQGYPRWVGKGIQNQNSGDRFAEGHGLVAPVEQGLDGAGDGATPLDKKKGPPRGIRRKQADNPK